MLCQAVHLIEDACELTYTLKAYDLINIGFLPASPYGEKKDYANFLVPCNL
jgi:hypothetical protein